jgi:hypothetical protein
MNDTLISFLPRIDTKLPTLFMKTKNDKGVDGVSTMSVDKTGNIASTGWCVVDTFPEEKFQITPSELLKILNLGRSLTIEEEMLVAKNTEFDSVTLWSYTAPTKEQSVAITYDETPIPLNKNLIQHLVRTTELNPRLYIFQAKDGILSINAEYSVGDSKFQSHNEHTMLRIPAPNLPNGSHKFDGPSMAMLLQLLNDNAEFTLTFQEKPSMFTLTGEGFIVRNYIMPIITYE